MTRPRVGVLGAGAIGTFVGTRLSAAGTAVTLVGRAALVAVADSIRAVPMDGRPCQLAADARVTDDAAALADVDVCLVTVKSRDTAAAAETLARVLRPDAIVVSLQNGLSNADVLREILGDRVVAGMVAYNVRRDENGATFRQATTGPLVAELGSGATTAVMQRLAEAFAATGDPLQLRDDVPRIAAGKLLLNLNNGICAVTGLTIAQSLRDRDARWCFAMCMREGLAAMQALEMRPATLVGLPPAVIARMLRLPNFIVLLAARRMVRVDPRAMSSTLQDVLADKPTEIDELAGAIVGLAERAGLAAPCNATIVEIVHGLPRATPAAVRIRGGAAAAAARGDAWMTAVASPAGVGGATGRAGGPLQQRPGRRRLWGSMPQTSPTRPRLGDDLVAPAAATILAGRHPDVLQQVSNAVRDHAVVVVGMAQNPHVKRVRQALAEKGVAFEYLEFGSYLSRWSERLTIKLWSGWPTFPQVFVRGALVGGEALTRAALADGSLQARLDG